MQCKQQLLGRKPENYSSKIIVSQVFRTWIKAQKFFTQIGSNDASW